MKTKNTHQMEWNQNNIFSNNKMIQLEKMRIKINKLNDFNYIKIIIK